MPNIDLTLQGSYKGLPFEITSASVAGGRKKVINQYPNSDTQYVEDLGLMPRKISLEIIIRDRENEDYFQYRDRLLAVIESGDDGVLIHPFYGRIDNMVVVTYSLSENFTSYGRSTLSVSFEVNNNNGIPVANENTPAALSALNDKVIQTTLDDIQGNYVLTSGFFGNFESSVSKVSNIIDAAKNSTKFVGETAVGINEMSALLGNMASSINSLVTDPIALSTSINALFETLDSVYASADATFDTFTRMFGFGSDEVEGNTAIQAQRKKNNDTLDGAINSSALSFAYVNATLKAYTSTDEIDNVLKLLDGQYNVVNRGASSQDAKDAINDLRVKTLGYFDSLRLSTSNILEVYTQPTSARLLAYNYYGNDNLTQTLIDINAINDASDVSRSVRVLSN